MKPITLAAVIAAAFATAFASVPATAAPAPAGAEAPASYRVVTSVKASGGNINAFQVDAASRRLFAAGKGTVDVIDVDSDKKVAQIDIPGKIAGIALAPDLNLGFAGSAGENTISVFDLKTLKVVRTIKLGGSEPASLAYEPKSKRLYVSGANDGKLTAIAAESGKVAGTASLGGRLRGIAADTRGHVFVADEENNVVHVVNSDGLKASGQMPTWPATKPTGLVLDNKERRVYVSTASGRMVVLDPDIGQMVGYVPIGKGDAGITAQFLPNRLVRLFVPTSDGQLTVVQNKKLTASVESTLASAGARSTAVAVDEKSGKTYLAGSDEVLVLHKGSLAQNVSMNK